MLKAPAVENEMKSFFPYLPPPKIIWGSGDDISVKVWFFQFNRNPPLRYAAKLGTNWRTFWNFRDFEHVTKFVGRRIKEKSKFLLMPTLHYFCIYPPPLPYMCSFWRRIVFKGPDEIGIIFYWTFSVTWVDSKKTQCHSKIVGPDNNVCSIRVWILLIVPKKCTR